jgi:hypothetical protein
MVLDNKSKSELIKKIGIVNKKQAIYKKDFERKNRVRPISFLTSSVFLFGIFSITYFFI